MSFFNSAELNRIKAQYYDPANPITQVYYKNPGSCVRLHFAIVDDNQDPDGYGRLKLFFPQWGDNVVSHWAPFARPYAGSGGGFWALPEVGDQVVCIFINDNPAKPVVLGCLYTPRAKPPISDNQDNNLKVLTTKSGSKIILNDTDGSERILIHTKDGEMRLVLDKANGLQIVNDKGDINIKCRKLTIEAGDAANIKFNKECSITCDQEKLTLESKKGMELKSGKDAVLSGSKIKIKGNSGVTAGVKQIAKKDDQVIGVDMHDIQVPSSSGLVTVPMIPHPYVGKLADKLSDDVTINDKAAAVKGSKSKYSTPGHIAMPPGVKFAKNPNNEGEVSSGTESSVKINGKEAAVLGSMVKTCNDPQPQETCTIVAVGVSVPLPIMIPGMDAEQFEKDGGLIVNMREPIAPAGKPLPQDIQRSLNSPQWSAGKAKVGEEVTLSVSLTNQYENANVYFTIWEEGADREKDAPIKKLSAPNKGGKAEVKWRYVYIHDPEHPLTAKPKFVFTVKSYRCDEVESGSIEWSDNIKIKIATNDDAPFDKTIKIITADGQETSQTPDDKGIVELNNIVPGIVKIVYETEKQSSSNQKKQEPAEEEEQEAAGGESKKEQPEFSNLKWMLDNKEVKKAKIGDIVFITAQVKNLDHGEIVRITIYEKNFQTEDDFIRSDLIMLNEESKIEFPWQVIYYQDREDDKKSNKPEFIFKLETLDQQIKSNDSPLLESTADFEIYIYNTNGELVKEGRVKLILIDGSTKEVPINNGKVLVENIPPGKVKVIYL